MGNHAYINEVNDRDPVDEENKGKTATAFLWSRWRAKYSLIPPNHHKQWQWLCGILLGSLAVVILSHRLVAYALTIQEWEPAPIQFIERDCPAASYPTISAEERPHICMTTLTDQQQADPIQKIFKWRQFDNLLEMTWPNKENYCEKYGYTLVDSSPFLDNSRPPSWSKIKAVLRLLSERDGENDIHCDWVVWLDADTVIMNSEKRIEDFLPAQADLVVTRQKSVWFNAGAWIIKNSDWSREFLQTWWNMDSFVRPKGISVSGDNDALVNLLKKQMPQEEFQKHIVVPPRCSFNSVTKWVTPREASYFQQHPEEINKQGWYMHEQYYHQGDLIAHVAGCDNKIDTIAELLKHAK